MAGSKRSGEASARLAAYRYAGAGAPASTRAKAFDLRRIDPAATPFSSRSKSADKKTVFSLAKELDRLQDLFYADHRFKMLVVLQGTDTSGKDGTIRGVFGEMSALGVQVAAWKVPTAEERAHDFLWRIHQKVPAAGQVVLFNRSHYEDVLVPVVDGTLDAEATARRYAQINEFERLLVDTGTVILKFFLHISKDEQRKRLQDRLDDPTKHWKFEVGDLAVRKRWSAYQAAYSAAIAATGTPWAPWTIVPADSKTHRNLMIANAVKEAFESLGLRYPPGDPALAGIVVT